MDIPQEPEAFDANENNFSLFSNTTDNRNLNGFIQSEPAIPVQIICNPILPIPPIETISHLLSNYSIENWKSLIPEGIRPEPYFTIQYTIPDTREQKTLKLMFDSCNDTLHSLFDYESVPVNVSFIIPYSLQMTTNCKLTDCLNAYDSIGESQSITQSIVDISNRPRFRTRVRPHSSFMERIQSIYSGSQNPNINNTLETTSNIIQQVLSGNLNQIVQNTILPSYEQELQQLAGMGFVNERLNYRILVRTMGNIEAAVNIILAGEDDDEDL